MKVVVTDLTRMRGGHICVAGIDPDTGRRVRPVAGQLGRKLLRKHGGPFDIRSIVEIGSYHTTGSSPEVEDTLFDPSKCVDCGDMPPDEFFELCRSSAFKDLSPIGPELRRYRRSLATLEGRGLCSLVLVSADAVREIFINNFGKLRYDYSADIELSVTDVRLYKENLEDPDPAKLAQLVRSLRQCEEVVLSFGLARAWQQPDDQYRRHYLQLNNIHLSTNPGWQLQ